MSFILGKKVEMLQFFVSTGEAKAATVIEAGPVVVTQVKTVEKDGYNAIQVGFGSRSPKNIKKPQKGHFSKVSVVDPRIKNSNFRWLEEFRLDDPSGFKVGDVLDAGVFNENDIVKVRAKSKGKGFQGVVKRHGFKGGRRTHGQKHSEREAGSIGATGPQKVIKGKRMAGRMGGENVTMKNLKILKTDSEKNLIIISGAIPGRKGALVELRLKN